MTKSLFVLRDVADFAAGAFENTAVEEGGIQLGRMGTGHLPEGSYTSPPFPAGKFRQLIPSWNADTPPGTSVELQVRVQVKGKWSHWFSFGIWCPYQDRSSPEPHSDDWASIDAETLSLLPDVQPAESAQVRVRLHSEEETYTPTVRLVAVAVRPETPAEEGPTATSRTLELPGYSCLVRDPSIAGRIGGATSLAMLMNRWGEDVLPEEIARAVYDIGAGTYENLSFLSAVGGLYGFECHIGFGGTALLRREIWLGHGVAAQVRYRAPAFGEDKEEGEPTETEQSDPRPLMPQATVDSAGHLVVVSGFEEEGGVSFVLLNDPMAPTNEAVARKVPLSLFEQMFTGIYLTLHRGPKSAGKQKPRRKAVQLSLDHGEIHLYDKEETLIPGRFTKEELSRSTLCYILSSPVAYASTAQRQFYYPRPDENGTLKFEQKNAFNRRLTFYRIGPRGRTWVAEKKIEEKPPEETTETPEGPDEKTADNH